VPSVYFGRPGALVTLPWPRGDVDKPYERLTFDFVSGSGQHTVLSMLQGSRIYSLNWNALHVDNFALLAQYWEGAMGSGPWVLVDPSIPNLLLPNQASATNSSYDTTGWATETGAANMGVLFSSTAGGTLQHRSGAQRALRWQFNVTPATTPVLVPQPAYRNWYGIPVQVGLPYTFSTWARPDSVVDSSITCAAKIVWLDAAGAAISTVTSGDIVMTGWTKLTATGTAPAGAYYARPICAAVGSTILVGASIYVDELLFEQDSVANSWAPGTGLRPVEIMALSDKVTFETRMRVNASMTLRELSA
jgi:hypothetical protein